MSKKIQPIPEGVKVLMLALAAGEMLQETIRCKDGGKGEWRDLSTLSAMHALPHLLNLAGNDAMSRIRVKPAEAYSIFFAEITHLPSLAIAGE